MYKKCEKTFEILRSDITFVMDLYSWYLFIQNISSIKIDKVEKTQKSIKLYSAPLS